MIDYTTLNKVTGFGRRQVETQLVSPVRELRQADLPASRVAGTFALATAASFSPIPMSDVVLGALLVSRFKRNRAVVMLALAIWNDLVILPLYAPALKLGHGLVGMLGLLSAESGMAQQALATAAAFVLGTLLLSLAVSTTAFVAIWISVGVARSRPRSLPFSLTLPRLTAFGKLRSGAG